LEARKNSFEPGTRFVGIVSLGEVVSYRRSHATNRMCVEKEYSEEQFRDLCTGSFKDSRDDSCTYVRGRLHSLYDQPAYIALNGMHRAWYKDDLEHRDNGPAFLTETPVGLMARWSQNGKAHRVDGPALISANRRFVTFEYQRNGQLHNSYGPALVTWVYSPETRKVAEISEFYLNGRQVEADAIWSQHRSNGMDLDREHKRIDRLVKLGGNFWECVQELFRRHWIVQ